jgi:hypothetical protein
VRNGKMKVGLKKVGDSEALYPLEEQGAVLPSLEFPTSTC